MKAIQVVKVGEPLELNNNAPIPHANKGQVVLKNRYSSINPMDWKV